MQQTEKYQFKLIEATDTFSPASLNENVRQMESVIDTLSEQTQSALTALSAKDAELMDAINSCGNATLVHGTYVGAGTYGDSAPTSLTFDFTPRLVVVIAAGGYTLFGIYGNNTVSAFQGPRMSGGYGSESYAWQMNASWSGNTVSWYNSSNATYQLNAAGTTYSYIAIG